MFPFSIIIVIFSLAPSVCLSSIVQLKVTFKSEPICPTSTQRFLLSALSGVHDSRACFVECAAQENCSALHRVDAESFCYFANSQQVVDVFMTHSKTSNCVSHIKTGTVRTPVEITEIPMTTNTAMSPSVDSGLPTTTASSKPTTVSPTSIIASPTTTIDSPTTTGFPTTMTDSSTTATVSPTTKTASPKATDSPSTTTDSSTTTFSPTITTGWPKSTTDSQTTTTKFLTTITNRPTTTPDSIVATSTNSQLSTDGLTAATTGSLTTSPATTTTGLPTSPSDSPKTSTNAPKATTDSPALMSSLSSDSSSSTYHVPSTSTAIHPTTYTTPVTTNPFTTVEPTLNSSVLSKLVVLLDFRKGYTNLVNPSAYSSAPHGSISQDSQGAHFAKGSSSDFIEVDTVNGTLISTYLSQDNEFTYYARLYRQKLNSPTIYHNFYDCVKEDSLGELGDSGSKLRVVQTFSSGSSGSIVARETLASVFSTEDTLQLASVAATFKYGSYSALWKDSISLTTNSMDIPFLGKPACLRLGFHKDFANALKGRFVCYAIAKRALSLDDLQQLDVYCGG